MLVNKVHLLNNYWKYSVSRGVQLQTTPNISVAANVLAQVLLLKMLHLLLFDISSNWRKALL